MRATFAVTYEIVTEESAAEGDAEERGFISESCDLREAIHLVNQTESNTVDGVECIEANESPCRDPRWITVTNGMDWSDGSQESRSLHFPDHITAASRRRVARLLGVRHVG